MTRKKTKMIKSKNSLKEFDKYWYYHESVQSPETDVVFFDKIFKELKKRKAKTLREDFCGTHAISCEWVKLSKEKVAYGVDLDPEPISYGQEHYASQLSSEQLKRLHVSEGNVLEKALKKVDIGSASNFSYFIFKERALLKTYFANAYKSLNKDSIFILDCFGGPKCQESNEEETVHDHWSYYWDQDSFDPITNYAQYYIHFKRKGEKKRTECFSYDWRMWSIPELKDILTEVGFKKVHIYWEGDDEEGDGSGEFTRTEVGEECEAWVAYIVAEN